MSIGPNNHFLKTLSIREGSYLGLLQMLNRILLILIMLSLGYNVVQFFLPAQKAELVMAPALETKDEFINGITLAPTKPFAENENILEPRDIFRPAWIKEETFAGATASQVPNSLSAAEVLEELKLVGIVLDKIPQAIIEDRQTRQTFFLHPGDTMKGAKILAIQAGRVKLNLGDQTLELLQ